MRVSLIDGRGIGPVFGSVLSRVLFLLSRRVKGASIPLRLGVFSEAEEEARLRVRCEEASALLSRMGREFESDLKELRLVGAMRRPSWRTRRRPMLICRSRMLLFESEDICECDGAYLALTMIWASAFLRCRREEGEMPPEGPEKCIRTARARALEFADGALLGQEWVDVVNE
jgi:hypothetical protein